MHTLKTLLQQSPANTATYVMATKSATVYYQLHSTGGNSIAYIHLSIHFYSNFRTEWPLALTYCICMGHDYSSPGSRSKVTRFKSKNEMNNRTDRQNGGGCITCHANVVGQKFLVNSSEGPSHWVPQQPIFISFWEEGRDWTQRLSRDRRLWNFWMA